MNLVTRDYVRLMARYNAWQNTGLREMLPTMSEAELTEDRGAFFGSILNTANHLLWGDRLWLSRFDGGDAPEGGIPHSVALTRSVSEWEALRAQTDARISAWADTVEDADLAGDLSWYSGAMQRDFTKPVGECILQFFNHQTHHRGQIHAMLTATGRKPQDTDIPFMPEGI